MSEWISVKDKLPEGPGRYLVSGKFSDTPSQIWICDFIGIGAIRGWSNPCRNPTVSFWMPLPEPPKEYN